ncbi:recombinase family protein [Streptomyces tanashiensis]|uniref:recombinase family protein n=1 Tax=Streptomyces tanashiensis TaxID=67367 RepID=UPI0033C96933
MPVALEYLHMVYPERLPLHGLLYGRNSVDEYGNGSSVETQISTGHDLCTEFGIEVVDTFEDPGVSASRYGRKPRHDFEALLKAIREKRGSIVIAFEASRYYRDLEQYVRLRKACMENDVLLCYNRTVYDLSKKEDRKLTAQDAIAAEEEVDNIRERAIRTNLRLAEQGRPSGRIIFGYKRRYDPDTGELIGQVLHEEQAPIALRCWQDVDAGKSTLSVAKWLNSLGEVTRRQSGVPWTAETVHHMLVNPSYIGKRIHRGRVIGDAAWPALLDGHEGTALFSRVEKKLSDPARKTMKESRVRHLLSRIALCGECGDHGMMTARSRPHNKAATYLTCSAKFDTCMPEKWLDPFVQTALLAWLASPAARNAFLPEEDAHSKKVLQWRTQLAAVTKQLGEARELAGEIDEETNEFLLSPVALATLERKLTPTAAKLTKQIADATAGTSQGVTDLILAPDPWKAWFGDEESGTPELPLEQKRDVIRNCVTVRVYKTARRGVRAFDPERIKLSFFGTPGYVARAITPKEYAKQQQDAAVKELAAARGRRRGPAHA